MRKLLRALIFLLVLPAGAQAQFEKAFETPQPHRIKALEMTRSAIYGNADLAVQREAYSQLLRLADQRRDPQSVLYARACLAVVELKLDSTRLMDFTEKMRDLIQQSMATDNQILQVVILMDLVGYLGSYHRLGVALSYYVLADDIMDRLPPGDSPLDLVGFKLT
jgi:hypothetical protein